MFDAAWCKREYNPRFIVSEVPAIVEGWKQRAAAFRASHPGKRS
jgi:hypothetical protein